MSKKSYAAATIVLALAAGCARGDRSETTIPYAVDRGAQTQSGVVHGNFTEYALPSGANPSDFTRGPYNTLWFHSPLNFNTPQQHYYRFTDASGAVATFSVPSTFFNWSTGIISTGGFVYYVVAGGMGGEDNEFLIRISSSGASTIVPTTNLSDEPILNLMFASDGNLWFPLCVQACGNPGGDYVASVSTGGTVGNSVHLPDRTASFVAPGPGGFIYATAVYDDAPPPPANDSQVFVISTAGAILHTFTLPHLSNPAAIVDGSDHNLWITEPGINKIARMTPSGTITQFSIPTAKAQPNGITAGTDGALWFTETAANKIGRITTSGSITEYLIPTVKSGATAIQPCSTNCSPHGGVWFTETTANKIGKFISPL